MLPSHDQTALGPQARRAGSQESAQTRAEPGLVRPTPPAAEPTESRPASASAPVPGAPTGSGPLTPSALRGIGGRPLFFNGEELAGRYRIERFIARGGMGEVYEAEDLELRERVALKALRLDLAEDPRVEERFKRELQLARRVTHANVCRIFDCGRHVLQTQGAEGPGEARVLFLTMELLRGETLSARLKRCGGLLEADALPIARQIAEALDAAHQAGIIHRDLKSSNVLLVSTRDGGERAVVTDFGLARAHGPEHSGVSITVGETFLGTPAYMAPEQVEGKTITPAADLYAFGVVLYEMVTGRWPFQGDTPIATAVKRLYEPAPPPSAHVPTLDPRWDRAIQSCLDRDPQKRPANAAAVVRLLEADAAAPAGAPEPRALRRTALVALSVGAALLAAGAAFWGLGLLDKDRGGAERPALVQRRSVAVLGFKNLAGRPEAAWLGTALAEMLGAELAAAESLRLVPAVEVSRMRSELKLGSEETVAGETAGRIRRNLDADLLVLGSFLAVGGQSDLRFDVRLVDAASGETLGVLTETGAQEQLLDLVSRAGSRLRGRLGAGSIAPAPGGGARAALPAGAEAARLYAQGLERLRGFDPLPARDLLQKAVEADPDFPLGHRALAEAWAELGYTDRARTAAERAYRLAAHLPREELLRIEGYWHELAEQWDDAAETWRTLFGFFPDNLDYGLHLGKAQVQRGRLEEAGSTVQALRALPAPASEDPRIDLLEGDVADARGDYPALQRATARAADKAAARGATLLQASALTLQAWAWVFLNEPDKGLALAEQAMRLATEAGDQLGIADALEAIHPILSQQGRHAEAAAKSGEAAKIALRLGNPTRAVEALYNSLFDQLTMGDIAAARRTFDRIRGIGLEPGDERNAVQIRYLEGWLLGEEGELRAASVLLEQVLADWSSRGDQRKLATAHRRIADVLLMRGELPAARPHYEEALRGVEQVKLVWYIAQFQQALAAFEQASGRPAEAERLARLALSALQKVGAVERQADVLATLAEASQARGDAAGADSALRRALEAWPQIDNVPVQVHLAIAALALRGGAEDLRRLERQLEIAERRGAVFPALKARLALGRHELRSGKPEAGAARLMALAEAARARGFGQIEREALAALP
jgi:TolB-like protein